MSQIGDCGTDLRSANAHLTQDTLNIRYARGFSHDLVGDRVRVRDRVRVDGTSFVVPTIVPVIW